MKITFLVIMFGLLYRMSLAFGAPPALTPTAPGAPPLLSQPLPPTPPDAYSMARDAANLGAWQRASVGQILLNARGDRDGLLVRLEKTQQLAVLKVPPHLWTKPTLVAQGEMIRFNGTEILTTPNLVYDNIILKKGEATLIDATEGPAAPRGGDRRARPLFPETGELNDLTVEGSVLAVSANPQGQIDEVIMQDGTIAHVPPHVRQSAAFRPQLGQKLRIVGVGGNFNGRPVLDADSVQWWPIMNAE
jgi:hypothetical protein